MLHGVSFAGYHTYSGPRIKEPIHLQSAIPKRIVLLMDSAALLTTDNISGLRCFSSLEASNSCRKQLE